MTPYSHARGHPIYWDGQGWRYADDDSYCPPSGGYERPCVKCGLQPTGTQTPDPCLGELPGVVSACCGHGLEEPWMVRTPLSEREPIPDHWLNRGNRGRFVRPGKEVQHEG